MATFLVPVEIIAASQPEFLVSQLSRKNKYLINNTNFSKKCFDLDRKI